MTFSNYKVMGAWYLLLTSLITILLFVYVGHCHIKRWSHYQASFTRSSDYWWSDDSFYLPSVEFELLQVKVTDAAHMGLTARKTHGGTQTASIHSVLRCQLSIISFFNTWAVIIAGSLWYSPTVASADQWMMVFIEDDIQNTAQTCCNLSLIQSHLG